jgi:uncharacterized membrane protein (UPF0182 family)
VLVIVFGVGGIVSRIWTNYLWYQEVGYTTVFWTPILAQLAVGAFFAVVFFIIFYGSLWLARKISPRLLPVRGAEDGEVFELASRRKWPGRFMLIVSIVVAIFFGAVYSRLQGSSLCQRRGLFRLHFAFVEDPGELRGSRASIHLHRHQLHLRGRPGDGTE